MITNKVLDKRVLVLNITIILLLTGTMFLSSWVFVEAEILSKWYAFIGGSLMLFLTILFVVKVPKIPIDSITILTSFFVGYLLLISFLSPLKQNSIHIISLVSFILVYYSFKLINFNFPRNFDIIILCVVVMQSSYGLMQYVGIFNIHNAFKIVGSFNNPAGFTACLIAGFPLCLSFISKDGWRHYFGIIVLLMTILSVILSESRAGIIAVSIVIGIYFWNRYYSLLKKYRKYFTLIIIITLLVGGGLFFLKKDSTLGRVLIWKNSYEILKNTPLIGNGSGFFMGNYMKYQAIYFEKNVDSVYSMLADNVIHPFNEYLLLT